MKESFPAASSVPEISPEERWIEDQYQKPETLELEGHELRVLDIKPLEAKTDVPVVLAPSYGSYGPDGKKVNIVELAKQKRRVLYVDESRGIPLDAGKENPDEIEEFFLRQAEALVAMLDGKEIEKADIVALSEGCIYAVVAASLYPERFRNIVLFNPAGMIADDNFAKLGYRFLTDGVKSLLKMRARKQKGEMSLAAQEQMRQGDAGFLKYLNEDKLGSIQEVRAMAKTRIRSLLKRAKDGGVGISIVHGVDDDVFPMPQVQKELSRTSPDEDLVIDGFYSVKGRHGELLMDPERYTQVADIALSALEKKQETEHE